MNSQTPFRSVTEFAGDLHCCEFCFPTLDT
jgi:hypothetical protein